MKNQDTLNAALKVAKNYETFAQSAPLSRVYLGDFDVDKVRRRLFLTIEAPSMRLELYITRGFQDRRYEGPDAAAFLETLDSASFAEQLQQRSKEWTQRTLVNPWERDEGVPLTNLELLAEASAELMESAAKAGDGRAIFYRGPVDQPRAYAGTTMAWAITPADKAFRVDLMDSLDGGAAKGGVGNVQLSLVGVDARARVNAIDPRQFLAQFTARRASGFPRF